MRVHIHKSGRDDAARSVYRRRGVARRDITDRCNAPPVQRDIAATRQAGIRVKKQSVF